MKKRNLWVFPTAILIITALTWGYKEFTFLKENKKAVPLFEHYVKTNSDYTQLNWLEQYKIKHQVIETTSQLLKNGWPSDIIEKGYLKSFEIKKQTEKSIKNTVQKNQQEPILIGGTIYKKLWAQANQDTTPKAAQQRLQILLHQLDFPKNIHHQPSEINHFLDEFSPNLTPLDPFWEQLATTVQIAFPDNSLSQDTTLAHQVHQLRYIISTQQAQWVREHFKNEGEDDYAALAKYFATLSENEYDLSESARFHNKVAQIEQENDKEVYADDVIQHNFKAVINFHTEFILSESGNFLNKIDPELDSENGIINGASFNYANKNDSRHKQLDVEPVAVHDPNFIIKETKTKEEKQIENFKSPSKTEEKQKNNQIYSYKGKSSKTLTKEAVAAFKELIAYYHNKEN